MDPREFKYKQAEVNRSGQSIRTEVYLEMGGKYCNQVERIYTERERWTGSHGRVWKQAPGAHWSEIRVSALRVPFIPYLPLSKEASHQPHYL
jgi:hypothetical protein